MQPNLLLDRLSVINTGVLLHLSLCESINISFNKMSNVNRWNDFFYLLNIKRPDRTFDVSERGIVLKLFSNARQRLKKIMLEK